jgi:transcription elongation factor
LFLFNPEFDKTCGVTVEKADNCMVVAKNVEKMGRGYVKPGAKPAFGGEDEDLKVGKSITIGSGPLKGYRGVIKSINKDRIEVRIPQKNCTEWIQRDKISQPDSGLDYGKTPRRGVSMTAMYAQSPMNY